MNGRKIQTCLHGFNFFYAYMEVFQKFIKKEFKCIYYSTERFWNSCIDFFYVIHILYNIFEATNIHSKIFHHLNFHNSMTRISATITISIMIASVYESRHSFIKTFFHEIVIYSGSRKSPFFDLRYFPLNEFFSNFTSGILIGNVKIVPQSSIYLLTRIIIRVFLQLLRFFFPFLCYQNFRSKLFWLMRTENLNKGFNNSCSYSRIQWLLDPVQNVSSFSD